MRDPIRDPQPKEAGRELDQLVSDTIFGPWDESRCRVCGWKIVPDGVRGCWKDSCSLRPPPSRRADEPLPFSTDIAAAWEVVEKLGRGFELHRSQIPDDEPWAVYRTIGVTSRHLAWGATAPLAICLAALEAVEVR